jgi:phospholipid/cholesterol/gamma-HCH transport system substrate-binding protein
VNHKSEALVGAVIISGLFLIVFGTFWLQGVTFRGDFRDLTAAFHEVGQIRDGNAVKFRGVNVGKVTGIEVDPQGEWVLVRVRIPSSLSIPDDAVVVLAPESLFGDWQAEIHPRGRFPDARFARHPSGEYLPGYALPDMGQLTATADQIAESIEVLTERVGIAFSEETARNIASLIENVEGVTQRLEELISQQATSFTDVTDEIRRATRDVGDAAVEAGEMFARLDDILARDDLSGAIADLAVISANLRELSGEVGGTNRDLREMAVRVDSTFARVNRVAALIESGDGSVARLLGDPTMAGEMEGTLQELRDLLADIRENPRRYLRLSIF